MAKKEYTYALQDRLQFGKYRGQLLCDVLNMDASYILWCLREVSSFKMTEDAWEYAVGANTEFVAFRPKTCTDSIEILDSFPWKDIAKAREQFMAYARQYAEDVEIIPTMLMPQAQQLSLF